VCPHSSRGAIPRLRWYYFVLAAAAIALPFILLRLAAEPVAVRTVGGDWVVDPGEYAGAETCRACHAEIVERQLVTNHALTVRDLSREPARAPLDPHPPIRDPLTGANYTIEETRGQPEIVVRLRELDARQRLDFEFGSGAHAHGFLGQIDDTTWVDARLNYYTKIQGWDFTSSQDVAQPHLQEQPLGRPLDNIKVLRCFQCHTTVLRADGVRDSPPDGSGMTVRPDKSVLGVTCEGCHGPRAEHARDRKAGKPVYRPAPMTPSGINQMCGKCHGLSDVNPDHPVLTRFQPWGLEQTPCFRQSGGKLSCVSCHDPHENLKRDTKFYESKCMGCHTGASGSVAKRVCPVNATSGCVGCHMPTDSSSMLHVSFSDHRIRIVKPGDPAYEQEEARNTPLLAEALANRGSQP
jgi:hypothetical protein